MNTPAYPNVTTSQSLYDWTQIIYVLHAVSLMTGILGVVTIVGMFLTGWPSIIAVIMNYIKRSEARGTWLDSHFRWQMRTFWSGRDLGAAGRFLHRSGSACSSLAAARPLVHLSHRAWLAGAAR